jgi:hypothetical protein
MTTSWWCHRFESWLVYGDPSLGLPATLVEEIGLKIVNSHLKMRRRNNCCILIIFLCRQRIDVVLLVSEVESVALKLSMVNLVHRFIEYLCGMEGDSYNRHCSKLYQITRERNHAGPFKPCFIFHGTLGMISIGSNLRRTPLTNSCVCGCVRIRFGEYGRNWDNADNFSKNVNLPHFCCP